MVLRNARAHTLRIAPLFDHGLSLLYSCTSDHEAAKFDIMEDKRCQNFIGGYSVTFNVSIDIPATVLYEAGEYIPLKRTGFIAFVQNNILDTSDSCNILECSRQNVAYMVKQQQLVPIKEEVKGNLYLKGDILKNKW